MVALVGVGNTVFHYRTGVLLFAAIDGIASLVALWSVWVIFYQRIQRHRRTHTRGHPGRSHAHSRFCHWGGVFVHSTVAVGSGFRVASSGLDRIR